MERVTPYEPKSARLYHTPYLQPLWLPKPPINAVASPRPTTNKSPRNVLRQYNGLSSDFGRDTIQSPTTTREFKMSNSLTYDQHLKQNSIRLRKYDNKLAQKYSKVFSCEPYKSSMIGAWQNSIIDHQHERARNETFQYQQRVNFSRQRSHRIHEEAERAHRWQMEVNGVPEPRYNY